LNLCYAAGRGYGDVRGNLQVEDVEDGQVFLNPAVIAVDEVLCGKGLPGSSITSLLDGLWRVP
jgi:hypothetical protein